WLIDLGPEGGENGGQLLAVGTPEAIVQNPDSITGAYLKDKL
ncbi:MAG: UvrABC system protein, partial [Bacteroidota bacterium]